MRSLPEKYVRRRAAQTVVFSAGIFCNSKFCAMLCSTSYSTASITSLRATARAANQIQRALRLRQARSELKRRRKDRHQRRLRAAVVRVQSFARVCSARAQVNGKRLQRRRWKKLHMPLAFSATQRVVARKRELACRLQRLYRGHSIRTLVKMRRLGGVCVDVLRTRSAGRELFYKDGPICRGSIAPTPSRRWSRDAGADCGTWWPPHPE